MRLAKHPWYFETDTPQDALAGRVLLERYLVDHCEEGGDLFGASIVYGELLSNVVKHAPEGGVRVWLEYENGRYTLCINDSGRGFSKRDLNAKPDDRSETGRGLFIISQICERLTFAKSNRGGFVVRAVLPLCCRGKV